ncbi:ABC transporter permease [Halobacillus litoralis]|uniref:ABC transporter permease n=1 Tax=Halobacillus litoralis TaxID=45668 RepID=UPI00249061ED|nr:ABC transporter permease [Halobacillus litoralis]
MNWKKTTFLLLATLLFIAPLLLLFLQSFSAPWRWQAGIGIELQLKSYQQLLSDPMLWEATLWSILIGFSVFVINLAIGLFTGKALASLSFKGKSFVEALLLSPILIPVLAIAMGLHLFMIRFGLADTLAGIIVIHLVPTIPYSIKIFYNNYRQLGTNMLTQPTILGASFLIQLFTVEMPLMKPAIRSVTFLTIVISLSQYAITAIIGGGRIVTLPMVFFPFMENANPSLMSAFAVWFAIIPIAMYFVIEALILLLPYSRIPWRNHR